MGFKAWLQLVAFGGLGLLSVAANADELVMPSLSAQWIAQDMTLNGVPASMRTLEGSVPLGDALNYYRGLWAGEFQERIDGDWRVLATEQGGKFVTLRIRSAGVGVRGVLTVSADPKTHSANLGSEFPIPSGLTRLAHQTFRDGNLYGENLTLMSHHSVAYQRQAFHSRLLGEGWALIEDRAGMSVPDARVMQFVKGHQQSRVVIYRDADLVNGNVLILVTWQRP